LRVDSNDIESAMKWFNDGTGEGENVIVIYPNLQTFREIYTQYVKDQLAKEDEDDEDDNNNNNNNNNNRHNEQSVPRIILIATFYETISTVKHNLSAAGVDVQRHFDNGSLVIVDAFNSYFPYLDGMKRLVASLSRHARKECRAGVSAIIDMGFFFLYGGDGKATELINYETSLLPKTEGGNVRGFSCYHAGNYNTLKDSQKKQLAQGQKKKLLEMTESAA
jgi:hypothetical protein